MSPRKEEEENPLATQGLADHPVSFSCAGASTVYGIVENAEKTANT